MPGVITWSIKGEAVAAMVNIHSNADGVRRDSIQALQIRILSAPKGEESSGDEGRLERADRASGWHDGSSPSAANTGSSRMGHPLR